MNQQIVIRYIMKFAIMRTLSLLSTSLLSSLLSTSLLSSSPSLSSLSSSPSSISSSPLSLLPSSFNDNQITQLSSVLISIDDERDYISTGYSDRDYVTNALSSLDMIYHGIDEKTEAKDIYNDVNIIMTNFRLKEKVKIMTKTISNDECSIQGNRIIDELNTLFEYFSISNDGKKKVMISDTVPGQKREFLRTGLKQIDQDIRNFLFCSVRG